METRHEQSEKSIIRLSLLLISLSSLFILIPAVAGLFLEMPFAQHCICVINYLSYSWIAFVICILLNIKVLLLYFVRIRFFENLLKYFENFLLILSGIAFIAGLVLFIIFACKYLNVL